MEFNITVPDKIVLTGELTERTVTLENCHSQNEVIEYLKMYIYISAISDNKISINDAIVIK